MAKLILTDDQKKKILIDNLSAAGWWLDTEEGLLVAHPALTGDTAGLRLMDDLASLGLSKQHGRFSLTDDGSLGSGYNLIIGGKNIQLLADAGVKFPGSDIDISKADVRLVQIATAQSAGKEEAVAQLNDKAKIQWHKGWGDNATVTGDTELLSIYLEKAGLDKSQYKYADNGAANSYEVTGKPALETLAAAGVQFSTNVAKYLPPVAKKAALG